MAELITYRDAVARALRQEMARDDSVYFLGEDVAAAGGVFKATKGLLDQLKIQTYHFHKPEDVEEMDAILHHTFMSRKPTAILTDSNFWGGY